MSLAIHFSQEQRDELFVQADPAVRKTAIRALSEHPAAYGRDQRVPGKLRYPGLRDLGNKRADCLLGIGKAERMKPARRQNRQLIVTERLNLENGNSHCAQHMELVVRERSTCYHESILLILPP